ncbi:hypothetical protein [Halobacillus salinus]|uniref:hypothetical protein n=1 Tax=Halobacillus salinus TaxID=192814 RepID=UPI0009A7FD43|nr:hypothetical protein [Halobacillus salinus]
MEGMVVATLIQYIPREAEVVEVQIPSRPKAVGMVDMDGDGVLELVGAYRLRGKIWVTVLKPYGHAWCVAATFKGKGYGVTYFGAAPVTNGRTCPLIVGWQVAAIWSDLSVYEWTREGIRDVIARNQYHSFMEVVQLDRPGSTCEIALWKHDTGKAYKVKVYRWCDGRLIPARDAYPVYFQKVVSYYKRLLRRVDSSVYWYYLADALQKIGDEQGAADAAAKAGAFKHPYPSKELLETFQREKCTYEPVENQKGIDFSNLKYVCEESEKNEQLEKAVEEAFDFKLAEENVRLSYYFVDLNDDGVDEVFVYLEGPFFCGTGGCSGAVFRQENGEYVPLTRFSLVRRPVIVSEEKTNGYRDLIFYVAGGGIEDFFARLRFDGTTYPSNPSIQSKVKPGTTIRGTALV